MRKVAIVGAGTTSFKSRWIEKAYFELAFEFCKRSLASYKKPKSVYFAESLPINEMGKVQKNILKEIYGKEE